MVIQYMNFSRHEIFTVGSFEYYFFTFFENPRLHEKSTSKKIQEIRNLKVIIIISRGWFP